MSPPIDGTPGGDGGEGHGEVVGGVERERELDGGGVRAAGGEELGGAQDEQRGGHVAESEAPTSQEKGSRRNPP